MNLIHGEARRGKISSIYNRWRDMKYRCYRNTHADYHNYGARGITVCKEWMRDFFAFKEWAIANGFSEELQIDRIDNSKGYSPQNCRWVTSGENNSNRRVTIIWPGGLTTPELVEKLGIHRTSIYRRLSSGWSPERVVSTPNTKKTPHRGRRERRMIERH